MARTDVRLRPVTRSDLPLFEAELCDPVMMEHINGPLSAEQARETLERQLADDVWSYVIATDDGDAGSVVLWTNDRGESEIGWMVLPPFQGRGLGKAATAELLARADRDGRWGGIHAFPAVTNGASNAICRSLGFDLVAPELEFEFSGQTLVCNHWRREPQDSRDQPARGSGTSVRS